MKSFVLNHPPNNAIAYSIRDDLGNRRSYVLTINALGSMLCDQLSYERTGPAENPDATYSVLDIH